MKCPACGCGSLVYKCNNCGDVRCGFTPCPGTMGGLKGAAISGGVCKVCHKGRYVKIS
jgi:hypothetical protein